jgi:hypothetical protein
MRSKSSLGSQHPYASLRCDIDNHKHVLNTLGNSLASFCFESLFKLLPVISRAAGIVLPQNAGVQQQVKRCNESECEENQF